MCLVDVLFVFQQLAALLVHRNVRPSVIIDCTAGCTSLTADGELAWGEAFLPPASACF